jgi:ligand-binding sensor domain-containing protein
MRASIWQANSVLTRISFLLGLLVSLPAIAPAEQLPVRTYTTADGLPSDLILRIVRDSHGFLWFCTADGLSRRAHPGDELRRFRFAMEGNRSYTDREFHDAHRLDPFGVCSDGINFWITLANSFLLVRF